METCDSVERAKKLLHESKQQDRKLDLLLADADRQRERLENLRDSRASTSKRKHKPSKSPKIPQQDIKEKNKLTVKQKRVKEKECMLKNISEEDAEEKNLITLSFQEETKDAEGIEEKNLVSLPFQEIKEAKGIEEKNLVTLPFQEQIKGKECKLKINMQEQQSETTPLLREHVNDINNEQSKCCNCCVII